MLCVILIVLRLVCSGTYHSFSDMSFIEEGPVGSIQAARSKQIAFTSLQLPATCWGTLIKLNVCLLSASCQHHQAARS